MNLIFFAHPTFLAHQSMPRFAGMLKEGMKERGHTVAVWTPKALFYRLPLPSMLRKWMGYIDQYIVFPFQVRRNIKHCPADTLFVFTDHALGPWVPLVADRRHVIHCHDFLAQQAALGKIPESPTGWTGKLYQKMIQNGYTKGKCFISVSNKTKEDLHTFLLTPLQLSAVVYNGLNQNFKVQDPEEARTALQIYLGILLNKGYVLHVGGNQWYKNRVGVIEIYTAWRLSTREVLPLILIGEPPNLQIKEVYNNSPFKKDIHFVVDIEDEWVRKAYSGATVFLFPSIAEGFGWPIAEAMASGIPVITTNEAPMTEVAGEAGFFIQKRPQNNNEVSAWASEAAIVVDQVVKKTQIERMEIIDKGLKNAERFNAKEALNKIENIYKELLNKI